VSNSKADFWRFQNLANSPELGASYYMKSCHMHHEFNDTIFCELEMTCTGKCNIMG